MAIKLFVGGLPYATTDAELQEIFAPIGEIVSARVITDRETGRSRGFGFVEMADDALAQKAIEQLDGSQVGGRSILVSMARPREERA